MTTLILIAIAALGGFFFFFYSTMLMTRKTTVARLRTEIDILEKTRIDVIRDGTGDRVPALIANMDQQIAMTKLELKAAIERYNEALETFPMSIVARHKQFEKER